MCVLSFVASYVTGFVPALAWVPLGDRVGTCWGPPILQLEVLPGDPANLPLTLVEGLPRGNLQARSHGSHAFPVPGQPVPTARRAANPQRRLLQLLSPKAWPPAESCAHTSWAADFTGANPPLHARAKPPTTVC